MNNRNFAREQGFVKEVVVIIIAILTLSYFGIDIDTAANFIKETYKLILEIFN